MNNTVRYEHRLAQPETIEYYGTEVIAPGRILMKTKTPNKPDYYRIVLGHGVNHYVPADKVVVVKITQIIQETEEVL